MKKILVMGVIVVAVTLGVFAYYIVAFVVLVCGMGNLKLKKAIRAALVILGIFLFYAGITAMIYVYRYGIPEF